MRGNDRLNGKSIIVIGVIVLVLGMAVVPAIIGTEAIDMAVTFYDADGNPVEVGLLSIYAGSQEVVGMAVKVKWTVTAEDILPSSFNAHIDVYVAVYDLDTDTYQQAGETGSIDSSYMISSDHPDANWEGYVEVDMWTLADILSEYMTDADKAAGWTLRIRATLTPTATDVAGNPVLPDPLTQNSPEVLVNLTWVTTTATMTIVSFTQKRWLNLP